MSSSAVSRLSTSEIFVSAASANACSLFTAYLICLLVFNESASSHDCAISSESSIAKLLTELEAEAAIAVDVRDRLLMWVRSEVTESTING